MQETAKNRYIWIVIGCVAAFLLILATTAMTYFSKQPLVVDASITNETTQKLAEGRYELHTRFVDVATGETVLQSSKIVDISDNTLRAKLNIPDKTFSSPTVLVACGYALAGTERFPALLASTGCASNNVADRPLVFACASQLMQGRLLDWYNVMAGKNELGKKTPLFCAAANPMFSLDIASSLDNLAASGAITSDQANQILYKLQSRRQPAMQ